MEYARKVPGYQAKNYEKGSKEPRNTDMQQKLRGTLQVSMNEMQQGTQTKVVQLSQ